MPPLCTIVPVLLQLLVMPSGVIALKRSGTNADKSSAASSSSLESRLARQGVHYSERTARELLELSACAYVTPERMERCVKRAGWTLHARTERVCDSMGHKCAALLAHSRRLRHIVVAFRGTQSLLQLTVELGHADWKRTVPFRWNPKKRKGKEADAEQTDEEEEQEADNLELGRTNRYFANALFKRWTRGRGEKIERMPSIWETVVKQYGTLHLEDLASYTLFFTGHSLGGALASLAALRWTLDGTREQDDGGERVPLHAARADGKRAKTELRVRRERAPHLYTFGQPRVGCPRLAKNIDTLIEHRFRIVFGYDIVPHLPPCNLQNWLCDPTNADSYFHQGIEIWYRHGAWDEALSVCVQNEDPQCSDRVLDRSALFRNWRALRRKLEQYMRGREQRQQQRRALQVWPAGAKSVIARPTLPASAVLAPASGILGWIQGLWQKLTGWAGLWKYVRDHRAYFGEETEEEHE